MQLQKSKNHFMGKGEMTQIDIDDIKTLKLEPGQNLVVKMDRIVDRDTWLRVKSVFEQSVPDLRIVY